MTQKTDREQAEGIIRALYGWPPTYGEMGKAADGLVFAVAASQARTNADNTLGGLRRAWAPDPELDALFGEGTQKDKTLRVLVGELLTYHRDTALGYAEWSQSGDPVTRAYHKALADKHHSFAAALDLILMRAQA